ncbi:MAG: glycosyltransferase family 2 protein [Chloroflexota bacterium]
MSTHTNGLRFLLLALQGTLAARVVWRIVQSRGGAPITPAHADVPAAAVSVVIPTLNEESRLAGCLAGAVQQMGEVACILVVDGGSEDGTHGVVRRFTEHDARIQWLSAVPIPSGWNGKAWGLEIGRVHADPRSRWLLTLDADTFPSAGLAAAMVAYAESRGLSALSAATRQELGDLSEGLLHPSLLTTLVYRFGIPGHTATSVHNAQGNGQCMLLRRDALEAIQGFASVKDSRSEDVTLARILAARGERVGFAEAGALISVRMYEGGWETAIGWTRSLPLRDRVVGWRFCIGLLEVTLVQTLPFAILAAQWAVSRSDLRDNGIHKVLVQLNLVLLILRLGMLVGIERAYVRKPWTYWISPLADVPMTAVLWWSAFFSNHTWRGRKLVKARQ